MSNLLDHKKNWDYTSEEELTKIYEEQYNDVFSKILLLNSSQFMNVLEKQIITYLYIIKKQPILSLLSRVSEYYIQKYYIDREKVFQDYKIIKETNIDDIEYLDKTNCYLHCPKTGGAFHTCGNKFILSNDHIFCLQCKKVYNEEQAKMFCDFCHMEYYTKLREVENEEFENFFPVSYENPHCVNEKEEKIKCKNCKEDLYVDISKFNNASKNENEKKVKIENLHCLKCKQNYKLKDLDFKCMKCNKKFFSDIKIFNEFNSFKTDYLCLVHTLLKRKYAFPKNIKKKSCKCELLNSKRYKHNMDKGLLLEGLRYGKKVLICNKCFKIFNYYNYNWNCPECGVNLTGNNNGLYSKEFSESSSVSYKIDQEKNNVKQNNKYNTAASGQKTKNIFPNSNNKSEVKNGKIIINNNEKKNIELNEINNSKILRNSHKFGNNFPDKQSNVYNINNTFDKENKKNSNNSKDYNTNNKNNNINSNNNRINARDNKKLFNKVSVNEATQLTNANDKNNQTCNSLINSINSSIKLKNNFNEKNYNNNNNKTCIITFNENNAKEKNDANNSLSNKPNLGRSLGMAKLFSPENKNEKIEYSLRYNKDNKDINNLKNNKERITSIENLKSENKLKRSYNYVNLNEPKNINSKANSKNKKKVNKNGEQSENNDNNNNFNKIRKIYNREQINTNGNNKNNNNIKKIELGKNENILASAKSSINIHSVNNNLINNNIHNNINKNNQNIRGKNEQKSPSKMNNNGNKAYNKKQSELSKQELIKINYSLDKNKLEKEINNNQNNNNHINNRSKKIILEESANNNMSKKQIIGDNTSHEENKNSNISNIKKNQSVNLIISKNNNSLSKRKLNKVNINDNIEEERERENENIEDKIIQRYKGSPNHKRVDIVHSKNSNNNKNVQNINVKLSYDLSNSNYNVLNRSQNGKEGKDNKIVENKHVNRSINIVNNINGQEKVNNANDSNNNVSNSDNQKKKIINNIYKSNNSSSIGIIKQEDNEDENSYDYNVTKSINYSSNKNNKEIGNNSPRRNNKEIGNNSPRRNIKEIGNNSPRRNNKEIGNNSPRKNKLVENRYNNFNENNQIINENNLFIHDKNDDDKEKEKKKEKEKEKEKQIEKEKEKKEALNALKEKIEDVPVINSIYKKNKSEQVEKNKAYNINKENNKNINDNDSSKNISSEGYKFNCDNYNIVHLLGEGTFGKIYLVEDPSDSKKYALKKIAVSDMEELGENKKEFELLMKLSQDNPNLNVVKIFGIQVKKLDKFNLVMYVLMEAAQCDWENEIRNRNQYQAYYTEEELMKILTNLTSTLASLQKLGICHRDVKPQNILCFGRDNYKLSDFGEAKKKKKRKINGNMIYDFEGDTSKQTVRGTELYMSPILFKALHDRPEDDLEYNAYKSDVFSLGLCMLLSSTLGFQALYDIRELYDNKKIKSIIEKNLSSRYSKEYIKLIVSMLQLKEKNRPDFIELESLIQTDYYQKEKK